ncbi:guanylate kinase [Glaciecola sp. 1036]|uniref:guanylate kinase n=1 Tax=Alteromonadaceae TaxID=72275 RepID=UPI003D017B75
MVQPLGNLFIIAAPSGAGKSSLINALLESTEDLGLLNPAQLSVSHTTRAPRAGEEEGKHYHFVSVQDFESMIGQDAFFEYAKVFSNYYGTSKSAISDKLDQGIDVFLDIDWQGARQIKAITDAVTSIFILPPSIEELEKRLVGRGKDSQEIIQNRMAQAKSEMSHADEFDYVIFNDNFDVALAQLASIVKTASLSATKQSMRYSELFDGLTK